MESLTPRQIYMKEWRKNNKEKLKGYEKKRPSRSEYRRKYFQENKEYFRKYNSKKRNDVGFRIRLNLSRRINHALHDNIQKSHKTMRLLGCSVEEFRSYLESKFDEKMTWENYGKYWEIDHIKPCALFDLSKPEQQAVCFHYTNMQPLRVNENRSKSDNYAK